MIRQIEITGRGLAPAGLSWSLLERLTGGDQLYNHGNLEKVRLQWVYQIIIIVIIIIIIIIIITSGALE